MSQILRSGCVVRGFNNYISLYNIQNGENEILGKINLILVEVIEI